MMLSLAGVHELVDVPIGDLLLLSPMTMVIGRTSEHNDARSAFRSRVMQVQALLPRAKVVQRHVMAGDKDGDGNALTDDQRSSRYAPRQIADLLFARHIPGVLLMPDNEAAASVTDVSIYQRTVDVWTALTRLATDANVALAIGCTSTGVPHESQYALLTPLLEAMRDAARAKGLVHWFYTNTYFDPDDSRYRIDHLHRPAREIGAVCAARGLPMPPLMSGEFGIAYGYRADDGFRLRGMGDEEFADKVAVESRQMKHPFNLFASGDAIQGHGNRWRHFNVNTPAFWKRLANTVERVPSDTVERIEGEYRDKCKVTTPQPKPAPNVPAVRARVTTMPGTFANVRSAPLGSAADVGDLKVGDVVTYYPAARENGYVYVKVDGGASGWAFDKNGQVVFSPLAPNDPTPAPPSPPPTSPPAPSAPSLDPHTLTVMEGFHRDLAENAIQLNRYYAQIAELMLQNQALHTQLATLYASLRPA